MACQERAALQEKYEEDVEAYTASVLKMRDLVQAIPHVEFMILWKAAEACRPKLRNCTTQSPGTRYRPSLLLDPSEPGKSKPSQKDQTVPNCTVRLSQVCHTFDLNIAGRLGGDRFALSDEPKLVKLSIATAQLADFGTADKVFSCRFEPDSSSFIVFRNRPRSSSS